MNVPTSNLRHYEAFGGCLASELVFPELREARSERAPDWTLRVSSARPLEKGEKVGDSTGVELYRLRHAADGWLIEYGDTGRYEVSGDGTRITWYPGADDREEIVRSVVLGPAFALCLEVANLVCLHGSAVAIGREGIAFLGPKHFGKSTLALALLAAGARIATDDSIAIDLGPPCVLRPGVQSLRVWADSAEHLAGPGLPGTLFPGDKHMLADVRPEALVTGPIPFAAIYVLSPRLETLASPVTRHRLDPAQAAVALAHNGKLSDALVGMRAAAKRLTKVVAIARTVPVYELRLVRDLSRLDEVVDGITGWHEPIRTPGAGSE